MAKRTPTRSQSNDAAPAAPAQPKARRSRRRVNVSGPDTIGAYPGVEGIEEHADSRSTSSGYPGVEGVEPHADSRSMGSEPSEEDIRMRAYQRYLQRGGDHGMDFEDWLEAERELKRTKV